MVVFECPHCRRPITAQDIARHTGRDGGIKLRDKKSREDPDYYRRIGKKGVEAKRKKKLTQS